MKEGTCPFLFRDVMFTLLKNCLAEKGQQELGEDDPEEGVKELIEMILKKMDLDRVSFSRQCHKMYSKKFAQKILHSIFKKLRNYIIKIIFPLAGTVVSLKSGTFICELILEHIYWLLHSETDSSPVFYTIKIHRHPWEKVSFPMLIRCKCGYDSTTSSWTVFGASWIWTRDYIH